MSYKKTFLLAAIRGGHFGNAVPGYRMNKMYRGATTPGFKRQINIDFTMTHVQLFIIINSDTISPFTVACKCKELIYCWFFA